MIKIGVDGRLLQGNLTGVGKYVLNLIEYICLNAEDAEVRVYTNRDISCRFNSTRILVVKDKPALVKIKPMVWSKFLSHQLINKDNLHIYLSGDTFVPLFLKAKNIVSVVHDVAHIIAPETMSSLHLLISRVFFRYDLNKASAIISNSHGTADKVKRYLKKETDIVIYPILDSWFKKLDSEKVKSELQNLGINYPFILSVATHEPRKNLDKTIKAFISLKNSGELKEYKLLLVGSKGWKSDSLQELINTYKDDIISLGYTENHVIPYLYNGAALFVFPSKYEGFGMPPREAMLCGCKVLVSDIPELREATYNKGFYINPEDESSYPAKILDALESTSPIADLQGSNQLDNLIPLIRNISSPKRA